MITEKLKRIRLLLLDVDGVLTAGEIIYSDNGEQLKIFDVKDGLGLRLLRETGIQTGIITGRTGKALRHRCNNLGIDLIFDGVVKKSKVLETIADQTGITVEDMAFVGDDLPDIAIMKQVGLAVAVADAHESVQKTAHLTTRAAGGRGAVREVCEALLKAQDRWEPIMNKLFNE